LQNLFSLDSPQGAAPLPPPFYLFAEDAAFAYNRLKLAAACDVLNRLGHESYAELAQAQGAYWAPTWHVALVSAHYNAQRKPVVLRLGPGAAPPLNCGIRVNVQWTEVPWPQDSAADMACFFDKFVPEPPCRLRMPLPGLEHRKAASAGAARAGKLLYTRRYTGVVASALAELPRIDADFAADLPATCAKLQTATCLYLYEWSDLAISARWYGCAVVMMPNAQWLPDKLDVLGAWSGLGLAWGDGPEAVAAALATVADFASTYQRSLQGWQDDWRALAQRAQALAEAATTDAVWPADTLDQLPGVLTDPDAIAQRADRLKYKRVNEQYAVWQKRSTLREIDAQIYAEHLVASRVAPLAVVLDHVQGVVDDLADTLDGFAQVLGEPRQVLVVSDAPAPEGWADDSHVRWCVRTRPQDARWAPALQAQWVLLLRTGCLLAPSALMEWGLAAHSAREALIIYADEDVRGADGQSHSPFFKPEANVELLRCMNYLGASVLVRRDFWLQQGCPLTGAEVYRAALVALAQHGRAALAHVDTVLFHGPQSLPADTESAEFEAAQQVFLTQFPSGKLVPLSRVGTWLPAYPPVPSQGVSWVIPTGVQTGYLTCLLASLARYPAPGIAEFVLVCQQSQRGEVAYAVANSGVEGVRVVDLPDGVYNHGAALNHGLAHARCEVVLVSDDDTEAVHANWLGDLVATVLQPDVGCVGPRIVTAGAPEPLLMSGPMILGVGGAAAAYVGENQRVQEGGYYARLQLSQDVSAVAGHFFMLKRADWQRLGGFDTTDLGLFYTVLDYCLRAQQAGLRHVWTPRVNVMHQGGKSVAVLRRDVQERIRLAQVDLAEREVLTQRWKSVLSADPNYNRHLSLQMPFDVESDIVIDWQPKRQDRPRVLAVPIHSGAGQYRVIEPLEALQDAGLAQSSVVMPLSKRRVRLLQPLELLRANPDRLLLQHSVDDGHLSQIESFKTIMPHLPIVQTVDDLLGEVPKKHPGREFQVREGHSRMTQALVRSDRLIVTTQPLVDMYSKYVPDVWIVPNSLGEQWKGLRRMPKPRQRLRVGWVGAGQHQGDLDLVNEVVRQLATEVDWVFMGMYTKEMAPYLKEFHGFVAIDEYPKKMASLDLDIAIAPLEDNLFNQCKSNLRLLEYGAVGWPVVCSDVYPYRTHDAPVLCVPNEVQAWVAAIRSLYDTPYRLKQADRLRRWVDERYWLSGTVRTWSQALFAPARRED
jgi:GT2 family glycosyltransferase/glycosyltransferase involved in cell wall biosynthesis